jgi:acetyl-CoA carboxylase biotin carboxylase subunit
VGGGKGIQITHDEMNLLNFFPSCAHWKLKPVLVIRVYEKMIIRSHTLKLRVLGDKHGNYIHLEHLGLHYSAQASKKETDRESPSPVLSLSYVLRKLGKRLSMLLKG